MQRQFTSYSRQEHSVGCESTMRTICFRLIKLTKDLAEGDPRRVLYNHCSVLRLAALVHDLGHGALSHGLDSYLRCQGFVDCDHEHRGVHLVHFMLLEIWNENWLRSFPQGMQALLQQLESLITGKNIPLGIPVCMHRLVNSPNLDTVDVDRMDYIPRDVEMLMPRGFREIANLCKACIEHNFILDPTKLHIVFPKPENLILMRLRLWLFSNIYEKQATSKLRMDYMLNNFFQQYPNAIQVMYVRTRKEAEVFTSLCVDPGVVLHPHDLYF
jgi:hypothetical protein